MRRVLPLAGLLLVPLSLAAVSAVAFAQSTDTDAPRARVSLDANRDGAIDRAEAAKAPRFAEHFDKLDRNQDGRLARDERGNRHGMRHRGGKHGQHDAVLERPVERTEVEQVGIVLERQQPE